MLEDSIEFNSGISQEDMGALNSGFLKLSGQNLFFKNASTGKLLSFTVDDIDSIFWQKFANKPGFKVALKNGVYLRFCGFKESDFNKINNFCKDKWNLELQKRELCIKGWNYGEGKIEGQNLVFEIDKKLAFEIPLSNVSHCGGGSKSEVSLEFHVNEDCPVQLVEMRLHVPQDGDKTDADVDEVEEFRKALMQFAEVEGETDQPIVTLPQILCATPRGRYDIKVFQNQLFFHGKTYDYKIPFKSVTRMFLLPHKDGRHMFFVLHINPPIRQGQTRYPFLVLEFSKEEYIEVDLALTDEQIAQQYGGKLEGHMKGLLYEIMAKLFRELIKSRIIIPGKFEGASGTPAVACALRQASGYLYPLEKGFVYVHKPPMYIRFEEIDNVHFARSDVSTRSFDFEVILKSGTSILFSSVGKEEYNKLFDYVQKKGLKIRNATRLPDKPNYKEDKFVDSDEELDPYAEGLKQDVKNRAAGSDSDSEDEDFDVEKAAKKQKDSDSSDAGSGSEPDEEYDSLSDDVSDDMMEGGKKKEKAEKPKKKKKQSEPTPRKSAAGGDAAGKKKKVKDPNAPKRNQTAFFLWQSENRSKIKKDGDSVADTATRAGQLWKAMSEEEKKPYEEKAKADKERYEREMSAYKMSKPTSNEGDVEHRSTTSKPKKSSEKQVSPTKKAISREFVEDSDNSSDDDEPAEKKSKKNASETTQQPSTSKRASSSDEEEESSAKSTSSDEDSSDEE